VIEKGNTGVEGTVPGAVKVKPEPDTGFPGVAFYVCDTLVHGEGGGLTGFRGGIVREAGDSGNPASINLQA
jgi:hypothetical protein